MGGAGEVSRKCGVGGDGSIITVWYSAVLVSYTVPINRNISQMLCQIMLSLALHMIK